MTFTEIMAALADLEARHADLEGVTAVFAVERSRVYFSLFWGEDYEQNVDGVGDTPEGALADLKRQMRERAKTALVAE